MRRIDVISDEPGRYGRAPGFAPGVRVHGRKQLDAVQRELRDTTGVTALIYDQACAAELRRERKRGHAPTPRTRVMINEAVCEGCGHCGDVSNCLSVHPVDTPFGRKTRIHQDSCNLDMSCIEGDCPAFVTVTPRRSRGPARREPGTDPRSLPEPSRPASAAAARRRHRRDRRGHRRPGAVHRRQPRRARGLERRPDGDGAEGWTGRVAPAHRPRRHRAARPGSRRAAPTRSSCSTC